MAKMTPMMQQYLDTKERYTDCLLFFRLGDFYEMFFEDAKTASRELEIALTGRDCGQEERAPMCGVPYHAAQNYITRLVQKGYKVAICEQMEDPAMAKGIVRRDVTRVVTPGTVTDPAMLEEKKNNFLLAIHEHKQCYGIAAVDITTGEFFASQLTWGSSLRRLVDEIARLHPSEIVVGKALFEHQEFRRIIRDVIGAYVSKVPDETLTERHAKELLEGVAGAEELGDKELARIASGALMAYLVNTQKMEMQRILRITPYVVEHYMTIDSASRRNLELTETLRDAKKRGSLLWVLDKTATAMGGRKLRRWLEQPLLDIVDIETRLTAVAELKDSFMARNELMELLRGIYDIERLSGKLAAGTVNARDLLAIAMSLGKLPAIEDVLSGFEALLLQQTGLQLDRMEDACAEIFAAISEEAPLGIREGGIIKEGYHETVDELRRANVEGKTWLANLEAAERDRTGIRTLKIKYTDNFGYFFEVTKANMAQVPNDYIRKQTLVNAERFTTPELKHLEDTILGAEKRAVQLEYELFCTLRDKVAQDVQRLKKTADALAVLDALAALAETADRENYVRPQLVDSGEIRLENGRHPVIEKLLENDRFVPNDTFLDMDENRTVIITGPNMAGKSTYMRQVAVITLMAQAGSFVPADSAVIGICDRIFTRVGASDDLASGQSTFMVEMAEMANILKQATPKSLLILDEIGRGTSTYDGLAIAWSVIEYINDRSRIGARTLFATHYHELTELESRLHGIKNYCITARKKGEDLIFLRKIVRGGADESYGIEVAKLAGVPEAVVSRARVLLTELDEADIMRHGGKRKPKKQVEGQLDLTASASISKAEQDVINEIRALDASTLTPLDALNRLYALQLRLK